MMRKVTDLPFKHDGLVELSFHNRKDKTKTVNLNVTLPPTVQANFTCHGKKLMIKPQALDSSKKDNEGYRFGVLLSSGTHIFEIENKLGVIF